MNIEQAAHQTRNGDGAMADVKLLSDGAEVGEYGPEFDADWRAMGVCTKKSYTRGFCPAGRASRNPPPPGEHNTGSATQATMRAANTASNAFPPALSTSAAASAVN
jgi:hypothetical protein